MTRWPMILGPLRRIVIGVAVLDVFIADARLVTDLLASLIALSDSGASALRRVGVIGSLVAGYWVLVRFHERRVASELTMSVSVWGAATITGVALISLTIVPLYVAGCYEIVTVRGFGGLSLVALGILAAAAIEEFFFRGVLFRAVEGSRAPP